MGRKRDMDDEKAVEEVLREAMDMVILEQVAAINNLQTPTQNTSHSSRVRQVGDHQTMKKLQRYEKWLSQPSKSAGLGRFSRSGFWCWRRESKEERERDRHLQKMVDKAKKEEDKIRGQAEKVINWVNYASAHI